MNPSEYCEVIVKKIKESNLHYILNENAFSIEIKIKKKFIDDKPHSATKNKLKESSDLNVKNENQKVVQGNGLAFQFVHESFPLQHMSQPMSSITTQVPCTTPCLNLNMSIPPPYPPVSQNMNHSNSFAFKKLGHSSPRTPPGFPAGPDEHHLVQPAQAHPNPLSQTHPIQLSEKRLQMVPKPFKKNSPTTTSTSFPISESKTPFHTFLSITPTMAKDSLSMNPTMTMNTSLSMNPTMTNTIIPSLHPSKNNMTSTSENEIKTNTTLSVSQPRPPPPCTPPGQPPGSPSTTLGPFFEFPYAGCLETNLRNPSDAEPTLFGFNKDYFGMTSEEFEELIENMGEID